MGLASGKMEALTGHHHRCRSAAGRMASLVNNPTTRAPLHKYSSDIENDCPAQHVSGTEQPTPPLSGRSSYHRPQTNREDDICGMTTKVCIT